MEINIGITKTNIKQFTVTLKQTTTFEAKRKNAIFPFLKLNIAIQRFLYM